MAADRQRSSDHESRLSEACVDAHGAEVLDKLLDRKLLEQALRKQKLVVTRPTSMPKIARVAAAMGQVKPDGKPNIKAWLGHGHQAGPCVHRNLHEPTRSGPRWP